MWTDTVVALVVMVKLALVAPAATVTLAGTLATAWSSERATAHPPAGAAPLRVTVVASEVPTGTLVGLSARDATVSAAVVAVAVAGFCIDLGAPLRFQPPQMRGDFFLQDALQPFLGFQANVDL